jgi:hypothetical protein
MKNPPSSFSQKYQIENFNISKPKPPANWIERGDQFEACYQPAVSDFFFVVVERNLIPFLSGGGRSTTRAHIPARPMAYVVP